MEEMIEESIAKTMCGAQNSIDELEVSPSLYLSSLLNEVEGTDTSLSLLEGMIPDTGLLRAHSREITEQALATEAETLLHIQSECKEITKDFSSGGLHYAVVSAKESVAETIAASSASAATFGEKVKNFFRNLGDRAREALEKGAELVKAVVEAIILALEELVLPLLLGLLELGNYFISILEKKLRIDPKEAFQSMYATLTDLGAFMAKTEGGGSSSTWLARS